MKSFKDWLESSASTRARREAAFGLRPPMADFMSHSTPSAHEYKVLSKALKKKGKKVSPPKKTNNEIDTWIANAESLKKDLAFLALVMKTKKTDKKPEADDAKTKVDDKEAKKDPVKTKPTDQVKPETEDNEENSEEEDAEDDK